MTIGRSNKAASDTRNSVSWNVERGPNNGRNCFGCTSRDAGHSRVPVPPHMINGIIRLFIEPRISLSSLVVAAIPLNELANTVFDGRLWRKPRVAGQIADVGECLDDIAGLHGQHLFAGLNSQLFLQNRYDVHQLFRAMIADIVDPGRRAIGFPRLRIRDMIDQAQYDTSGVVDIGKVPAHPAMIKEPDWRAL